MNIVFMILSIANSYAAGVYVYQSIKEKDVSLIPLIFLLMVNSMVLRICS